MGQHAPSGVVTFSQLVTSLHWTSSQSATPLWQTQTRHGSGLHSSSSWCVSPSTVQPTAVFASMTGRQTGRRHRGNRWTARRGQQRSDMTRDGKAEQAQSCSKVLSPPHVLKILNLDFPPREKPQKRESKNRERLQAAAVIMWWLISGKTTEDYRFCLQPRNHAHKAPLEPVCRTHRTSPTWPPEASTFP